MTGFKSPNHTQVPNDFFDMIADMSDAELRVTLIMIRETRGWHRDAAQVGKKEIADRSGLSFNGVTAGCLAAEGRGTFRRVNKTSKKRAEWELVEDTEPSASEGVLPQPVREKPSASEGQVGVKERKEKIKQLASPKANDFPEVVLYRQVRGRYPSRASWQTIIDAIHAVSARLGRDVTADDLLPFYQAWCNRGWNDNAVTWLTDYAVPGKFPNGRTIISKTDETRPEYQPYPYLDGGA